MRLALAIAALLVTASACRDLDVVTESYATLNEAVAAGALQRGWLPGGLPAGTHEIRVAHDLDSARRWGLFNFPAAQGTALRSIVDREISLDGESCNPPRRIEWWPLLLRRNLDHGQISATGIRAYRGREGNLIFAVNWDQGRAYYWTEE